MRRNCLPATRSIGISSTTFCHGSSRLSKGSGWNKGNVYNRPDPYSILSTVGCAAATVSKLARSPRSTIWLLSPHVRAFSNNSSNNNEGPLMQEYQRLVKKGTVHHDEHQVQALQALERLRDELMRYTLPPLPLEPTSAASDSSSNSGGGWFGFGGGGGGSNSRTSSSILSSTKQQRPPRGVYLHGGVGSGKTLLMNLFYDSLLAEDSNPVWAEERQKIHYHKFMATVHKEMHRARQVAEEQGQHVSDAVLPALIHETAQKGRLLCLDEFQVTDVADALILQRLFTGLWEQKGCIVVATSNRAPSDLYLGGLQRDRFLPFIDLLQDYCQEVSMWESDVDYRLIQKVESGEMDRLWFVGARGKVDLDALFYDELVGSNDKLQSMALAASTDSQRTVPVPSASPRQGIARFSFADICQTAMGASDYLVIGQHFSTVVVDQIPTLTLNEINWVRRFILLVDSLYESNVKLLLHCQEAKEASGIFVVSEQERQHSSHDEIFAFDRTVSRLQEMSSRAYLRRKWKRRGGGKAVSSSS